MLLPIAAGVGRVDSTISTIWAVVVDEGGGEECLLHGPGSERRRGRGLEKGANIVDGVASAK